LSHAASLAAWAGPVVAVAAATIAKGEIVESPGPGCCDRLLRCKRC
jgi:hypothetical protein